MMPPDHQQPGSGSELPKQRNYRSNGKGQVPWFAVVASVLCLAGCGGNSPKDLGLAATSSESNRTRLLWTSDLLPGLAQEASFSPDGEQLIVQLAERGGPCERDDIGPSDSAHVSLWILRPNEAGRPITQGPMDVSPDWSPTGASVAYISYPPGLQSILQADDLAADTSQWLRQMASAVCLLDTSTGNVEKLQLPMAIYRIVRWSPDGSSIACAGTHAESDSLEQKLVLWQARDRSVRAWPLGASSLLRLSPLRWSLAWSDDGGSIVMDAVSHREGQLTREVYLLDVLSGSAHLIYSSTSRTAFDAVGFNARLRSPCFTHLEELSGHKVARLRAMGVGSGQPREVASLQAPLASFVGPLLIAPDGDGIAACPWPGEGASAEAILWSYQGLRGTIPMPFGQSLTEVLAWSRDGRRIAVSFPEKGGCRLAIYELPLKH